MNNQTMLDLLAEGTAVYGFKLEQQQYVEEISANVYVMKHERCGAVLVFMDTADDERSYSINFPVFPDEDTGVFHILEHCIPSATEKYPVLDWMDVGPQSSYFGAATNMGNCNYPVCSYIEKSFQDLVRLYTDSVFAPEFLKSDLPMQTEGWHYEYDEKADKLSVSGIVNSEMKANHDTLAYLMILARYRSAFPNSSYARDIGGAPAYIPTLTQEHFLETYHSVFHPGNALFTVGGRANVAEVLETIAPYLDKEPPTFRPKFEGTPAVWDAVPYVSYYPVKEINKGQTVLGFNWVLGRERCETALGDIAAKLLEQKLSQRLAEAGLCKSCYILTDNEPIRPIFSVILEGSEAACIDNARALIFDTIRNTLDAALSKDDLEGALSSAEFARREGLGFYPKGLELALNVTNVYFYGKPVLDGLRYFDDYAAIRRDAQKVMKRFLRCAFLENAHHTEFIMLPSATLTKAREDAEELRLRDAKSKLGEAGLRKAIENQKRLEVYHENKFDPEAIKKIPHTLVEDLPEKAPGSLPVPYALNGGEILYLDSAEQIIRLTLHFPVRRFGPEYLCRLGILQLLFGKTETQSDSAAEISSQINRLTGGVAAETASYAPGGKDVLFFETSLACLPHQFAKAQELLRKLLMQSRFGNVDTVKAALQRYLSGMETQIPDSASRACAYYSHGSAALQYVYGQEFRKFAQRLLADEDDNALAVVCAELESLAAELFDLSAVTVGISCARELMDNAEKTLIFSSKILTGPVADTPLFQPRELFPARGIMQFSALAGRTEKRTGALLAVVAAGEGVLRQQLRYIGGAYDVRMVVTAENDVLYLSGRDPHLRSTVRVFRELPDMVRELDDEMLTNAIINASGSFAESREALIGRNEQKTAYRTGVRDYFNGFYGEVRQRTWDELRSLQAKDVREAAALLSAVSAAENYCSFAAEEQIAACTDLFDRVEAVKRR